MTNADYLRKHMPDTLPWAVRELIIANVVVGNYTPAHAADLSGILARILSEQLRDANATDPPIDRHSKP